MKKNIIFAMLLAGFVGQAQIIPTAEEKRGRVSINTEEPRASLEVARHRSIPEEQPQGVLFPSFTTAERSKFTANRIVVGTMLYNTDKQCIEQFLGVVNEVAQWSCLSDSGILKSQGANVYANGFAGQYMAEEVLASSNTVSFRLVNNSASPISGDFSTAVRLFNGTGSVAVVPNQYRNITLQAGESQTLTYTLIGTPQAGTLQANFSYLGLTASQEIEVGTGIATIDDTTEYIVTVDYNNVIHQGKANNTTDRLTFSIPYTNGRGTYKATTIEKTTASGHYRDINTLTLSIPEGRFSTEGELNASITVSGSDAEHLVKLLPPAEEYTIAIFPVDLGGTKFNVTLKGIGGVPDRCFGKTTKDCVGYGADEKEHEFIYIPINGPDGRTWLNNNLGAGYANLNSEYYAPATQAGSRSTHPTIIKRDWKAYGSLFQWQRNPDGHELINWTNATSGAGKYGFTTTKSSSWTDANTNLFIIKVGSSQDSWLINATNQAGPHNLWQLPSSSSPSTTSTNPCPIGYSVPTITELNALRNAITGTNLSVTETGNNNFWADDVSLRLSATGSRIGIDNRGNLLESTGSTGYVWSSEPNGYRLSQRLVFRNASGAEIYNNVLRTQGMPVRCIKD